MTLRKSILLILIFLGLCAIGASVYLQYGKPYMREIELQKQDEIRITDLGTLDAVFETILASNATTTLGNADTVYISIPSTHSDCSDLDLPSLPDGWMYHCATAERYEKSDGTGWLPANLDLASLPINPINSAETLNYYSFVTSPAGWSQASTTVATSTPASPKATTGQATSTLLRQGYEGQATSTAPSNSSGQEATSTQYVLTAVLDSKKYLTEKAQTDGGTDPIRYEMGSDLQLWIRSSGLIVYLPLRETDAYVARDLSGNNIEAKIVNTPAWVSTEKIYGLKFDGINDYIDIPVGTLYKSTGISFGIITEDERDEVIISSLKFISEEKGHDGYVIHKRADGTIVADLFVKSYKPILSLSSKNVNDGKYHSIRIYFTSGKNQMYTDNELISRADIEFSFEEVPNTGNTNIGRYNYLPTIRNYFGGMLNEIRISNLSDT